MSGPFGVTPSGFVRKPLRAILDDLSAAQLESISAKLRISSASLLGQLNGIFARELGIAWEQLEICYHGNDPDASEDFLLTMVAKLTGSGRRPATQSVVTLSCNLDITTVLVAGTHFAALDSHLDQRWTPATDYTAGSSGAHDVVFVSENTGPIEGLAGHISVIASPLVGWNSVTNVLDAQLGRVVDDDPTLRTRRELELAAAGSGTARAIVGKVLATFPDVLDVFVYENDTDFADPVTGNAPHSLEVLIYDGAVPTINDDALAQLIWDNKGGGIQTVGMSSGTAAINVAGDQKTVYFSRATLKTAYLTYALKVSKIYAGDAALADYVATQGNARFGPGQNVIASVMEAQGFGVGGVNDVVSLKLGFTASPSGTTNLVVGLREVARFDTTRVVIADL